MNRVKVFLATVTFLLLASVLLAQDTNAPTFYSGYVWKQVVFQGVNGKMERGDVWGGRVVGGVGFGRLGTEIRIDASGLKDQFDFNNPATFKSIEGYGMVHYVLGAAKGLQVGPAVVVGSVSSFETNAPWTGLGVDVAGGGIRVGGYGSEVEVIAARTSFLREDPKVRFIMVVHARLTPQMTAVADMVSGADGFFRLGIAVRAF